MRQFSASRPFLGLRWLAPVFVTALLLSACGDNGNGATAEDPVEDDSQLDEDDSEDPEAAEEVVEDGEDTLVRIASAGLDTILYLPLTYAMGADLFAEEGLELDPFEALGGGAVARAVLGGSVDFAPMSFQAIVNSTVEGGDLVGFSLLNRFTGGQLLAHIDSADEIQSVADLEGRVIGIAGLGGGTHDLGRQLLAGAGIAEDDVTWAEVGLGATAVAALDQGAVEAIITYDPAGAIAIREGLAVVIWDGRTETGHQDVFDEAYPFITMAANRQTLEDRPEIAGAFARVIARAIDDIQELSSDEIWETVPEQYRGVDDKELYIEILEASRELFAPRGYFPEGSTAYAVQVIGQYNEAVAQSGIDPEQLYTNEFGPAE